MMLSPSRRLLVSGCLGFALMGAVPGLYGLALPGWSAAYGSGGGLLLGIHGLGASLAVFAGLFGLPGVTMRVGLAALAAGSAGLGLGAGWPVLFAARW